ncbi:MAG: class I SAM-dependent methyltransferase [Acidobacteriota bacterium]
MRQEATRSFDQVCVNWREQSLVEGLLTKCGLEGGSILDVPCGYGRFAPLFARLGIKAFGIDLDPEMVALAVGHQLGGDREQGACSTVFQLPFADSSFDGVVCIRLLHLRFSTEERLAIIRELARVSRRHVIISVYHFTALHGVARFFNSTPGRVQLMTPQQLSDLVRDSGLECQTIRCLMPYLHMQTFVVLEKKRG